MTRPPPRVEDDGGEEHEEDGEPQRQRSSTRAAPRRVKIGGAIAAVTPCCSDAIALPCTLEIVSTDQGWVQGTGAIPN